MPIDAECSECKATYKVKDEYAGKKFKCKRCSATILVPDAMPEAEEEAYSLQADEYEEESLDDDPDTHEIAPALPPRVKSGKRKKSKKAGRTSQASESAPVAMCLPMMVALFSIGVLFVLSTLDLVIGMWFDDLDVPWKVLRAFKENLIAGFMVRSLVGLAAIVTIVRRYEVMRPIIISYTSLGLCYAVRQFWEYSKLPDADMSGYIVIGGMVVFRIVIIACFSSNEAEEHFSVDRSTDSDGGSPPHSMQIALGALALLMAFSIHPIFMRAREINDTLTGYVRMHEREKTPGATYHKGKGGLSLNIVLLSAMVLIALPFRVLVFRGLLKGSRIFRQLAMYAGVLSILGGLGLSFLEFNALMRQPAGLGFAAVILLLKLTILWALWKPDSREYCMN